MGLDLPPHHLPLALRVVVEISPNGMGHPFKNNITTLH